MNIWNKNHRFLMSFTMISLLSSVILLYSTSHTISSITYYIHISVSLMITPHLILNTIFKKNKTKTTDHYSFIYLLKQGFTKLITPLLLIQLGIGFSLWTSYNEFEYSILKLIHHYMMKVLTPIIIAHVMISFYLIKFKTR